MADEQDAIEQDAKDTGDGHPGEGDPGEGHPGTGGDGDGETLDGTGRRVVSPTEVLPADRRSGNDIPGDADSADSAGELDREQSVEQIDQPARVMRIGSMVKQLLEEVRHAPLDEAGRKRLREIYDLSVKELARSLSPDLAQELERLSMPFDADPPSEAELRVAQAQLVGWLEGLFHGIQATLMAQQMAARAQLQEMRQPGLPAGTGGAAEGRPGTYL
jgi:hypothetical protein